MSRLKWTKYYFPETTAQSTYSTGWTKKNLSLLQRKTLSASYSKTTFLLGVEI